MKTTSFVLVVLYLLTTSVAFAAKPEITFDSLLKGSFGIEDIGSLIVIADEGAALVPDAKVKQAYWSTFEGPLNPIDIVKGSVEGKKYSFIPNIEIVQDSVSPEAIWFYFETKMKDKDTGLPLIVQSEQFLMGIPTIEYTVNEGGDFCSDGFANATISFKYHIPIVNWIDSDFGHFAFGTPLTDDFPCDQQITFTGHTEVHSELDYFNEEDLVVTFSSD